MMVVQLFPFPFNDHHHGGGNPELVHVIICLPLFCWLSGIFFTSQQTERKGVGLKGEVLNPAHTLRQVGEGCEGESGRGVSAETKPKEEVPKGLSTNLSHSTSSPSPVTSDH